MDEGSATNLVREGRGYRATDNPAQRMDSDDSTWRNESLGARTLKKTSVTSFFSCTGMDSTMFIEKLASRAHEPQALLQDRKYSCRRQ